MYKKILVIQEIECDDLEKLDMECEESVRYSNNADISKLSADILYEKVDEFKKNGDILTSKKIGKRATQGYLECIELNQKSILASDVYEEVFEVKRFKTLEKAKHSHNNNAINSILKEKNCNILMDEELDIIDNIFSSKGHKKLSPYNECRYGDGLPEINSLKNLKSLADKVDNRKREFKSKVKNKKDKNRIKLKGGINIILGD